MSHGGSSPKQRMPAIGEVLLGRFRLESLIGQGGMGHVFGARQLTNGAPVALKVLTPEASQHPEGIPRFLNEVRATTKLRSPHVVKIFDLGTLADGLPFIAMEWLEGDDLAVVLQKNRGPLQATQAVDYVVQALDAVAEAHTLGIVHRDLKPSNLFLARGEVKVLDFGISKMDAGGIQSAALTTTGTVLGSPHYMSPEQLKNAKDVDGRADIWSFGVILYELLAAHGPFDSGSIGQVFLNVLTGDYVPLVAARPEVHAGLSAVVDRCLRRTREERFAGAAELARALAPYASPVGIRIAERVGRTPGAAPAPTAGSSSKAFASTVLFDAGQLNIPPLAPSRPSVGPGSVPLAAPVAERLPVTSSMTGPGPVTPPTRPAGPPPRGAGGTSPWLLGAAAVATVLLLAGAAALTLSARARHHRAEPPASSTPRP